MRTTSTALIAISMLAMLAQPAAGETFWRYSSAAGYAPAGALLAGGLGVALSGDDGTAFGPSESVVVAALVGAVAGGVTGWTIGGAADASVAAGDEVSGARRNAVRLGTVFLGAAAGTAVGGVLINDAGDSGHDRRTVATAALVGVLGGALVQYAWDSYLHPRATPVTRVGPNGVDIGLQLEWTF